MPWDLGQVEEDGSPPGTQEGRKFPGVGQIQQWMGHHVGLPMTFPMSHAGEPQGSLHLSALMKLVKEIPEFLFGTSKAPAYPAEASGSSDAATSTEPAGGKSMLPTQPRCRSLWPGWFLHPLASPGSG